MTMFNNTHLRRLGSVVSLSLLVVALSSCGNEPDSGSDVPAEPPVIAVVGGPAGVAQADAMVSGGVAESSKMIAPLVFEYVGDEVDLTAPAPAYRFVPAATNSDELITRLAEAFGVAGGVAPLPAEQGGGLMIGPADGSAASVTVMNDALQSWWVTYPVAMGAVSCSSVAIDPVDIVEPDGAAGAASDATTDATGDVTTQPDCFEPDPPANVPGADEAERIVTELLMASGVDPATYEFETYADEWGASVTGFLLVDGVRSPISVSVGIGGDSKVTWAGGSFGSPERVAEYPRVGVAAAVERLNDQSNGWWSGWSSRAPEPAQIEPAQIEPVPVDSALVDPALVDPGLEDSFVEEPVVTTIRLSDPQPALEQIWGADNVVWLVPAYSFAGDDGGRYTAVAIDDAYLQPADADVADTPPPTAVDPADTSGAGDTPVASEAPSGPDVVGLTVDEATQLAEAAGWVVRPVRVDGEELAATADYVATRLNVVVEAGVVTEVLSIG
jgi:hypothetical protein